MVTRVVSSAVLIVLTVLTLTGCGRQASKESSPDLDLLATGPDRKVLPTSRPCVSEAIDAAGGMAAWKQCTKIEAGATVTVCARAGGFYLTEQDFVICPWSDAIGVTAHEPRADFVWQVVGGRYYAPRADPNLDVSPLGGRCGDYADAVLQITTAPVRMLDDGVVLTPRPATVQITGQWYLPVDVTYRASGDSPKAERLEDRGAAGARSHPGAVRWTQSVYFQNQSRPVVDMIWLGDPDSQKFLIVRGYDYARREAGDVLIPTKIDVFQSDPDANIGPRLALVDLKQ
jgi:hypothetical protein